MRPRDVHLADRPGQQPHEQCAEAEHHGDLPEQMVGGQQNSLAVHDVIDHGQGALGGDPLAGEQPDRLAQARAAAQFRNRARRFLCGRGVSEGDARIRVGVNVNLTELGPLFNGTYYVSEVRHTFDNLHGYRTLFTAERAGLGTH